MSEIEKFIVDRTVKVTVAAELALAHFLSSYRYPWEDCLQYYLILCSVAALLIVNKNGQIGILPDKLSSSPSSQLVVYSLFAFFSHVINEIAKHSISDFIGCRLNLFRPNENGVAAMRLDGISFYRW